MIVAPLPNEREEGRKERRERKRVGEREREREWERERGGGGNVPTTHYSDTKSNFHTQNIVPFLLTICLSLSLSLIMPDQLVLKYPLLHNLYL